MTSTPPPELTLDHYRDAVALCRATLANDDAGVMALARTMDVAMTFQALVRLHLSSLLTMAGQRPEAVDAFLANFLTTCTKLEDLQ